MNKRKNLILIDAHIHFHDCYDKNVFFNSAKYNFENIAKSKNCKNFQSVLCFTESYGDDAFIKLSENAKKNEKVGLWKASLTENENTIKLSDVTGFNLFIVAGKQIVTLEKLEVLALGLMEEYKDGKPIKDVLKDIAEFNVLSVIPWGVGKWFSSRKQIVENLVLQNNTYPIYLGDNGNRPFFWSKPNLFKIAEEKGIYNLPGSDPLPFKKEVNKPGSFGFIIDEILNEDNPFDSIYNIITTSNKQFETFGKLESPLNFLKNQVSMQIVKRNR